MTIKIPGTSTFWLVAAAALSLGWIFGFGLGGQSWGEATAAWVQAIGSIMALLATGLQGARLARMDREKTAAPLEVAAQAVRATLHHYDSFWKGAEGKDLQSWADAHLQPVLVVGVQRMFDELTLLSMPSSASVDALVSAKAGSAFLIARIQAAFEGRPGWNDGAVTTRARLVHCWKIFEEEKQRILGGKLVQLADAKA